jgi:hypothetical protein
LMLAVVTILTTGTASADGFDQRLPPRLATASGAESGGRQM